MFRPERRAALLAVALAACHSVREPQIAPSWTAAAAAAPLTHADCVRLACAFGPARSSWRARLDAAAAQVEAAGALPNPTLLLEWEDFALFEHVPASALQQTVSLSGAIGELLTRGRRREVAQHDLDATLADLLTERRQLALDVCRAYDELLAARRDAALARREADVAASHRDGLQRLAAAGEEPVLAAATAAAEATDADATATAAQQAAAAQELAFAFALGFERPVPLQLAEPIDTADWPDRDLEQQLAAAIATRPELAATAARYQAELERLRLAASPLRFVPIVGLGYRRLDHQQLATGTIETSLPIFDAGGAEVAAGDAALLAAAAAARQAAHSVAREVCQALQAAAAASTQRQARTQLAERRTALRSAAARWFAAGELTFADLREPVRAELQAERDRNTADLAVAAATWPLRIDALLAALQPTIAADLGFALPHDPADLGDG